MWTITFEGFYPQQRYLSSAPIHAPHKDDDIAQDMLRWGSLNLGINYVATHGSTAEEQRIEGKNYKDKASGMALDDWWGTAHDSTISVLFLISHYQGTSKRLPSMPLYLIETVNATLSISMEG